MTSHDRPEDRPAPSAADRRTQMCSDIAGTVQEATARRLSDAIADYDAALDRGASMPELRQLDREVARAEREHAAAGGSRPPSP